MTTTVETTTTTTRANSLPQGRDAWQPLVEEFLNEQDWSHVSPQTAARIFADATETVTDLTAITDEQIIEGPVRRLASEAGYSFVSRDNQRWVDWLRGLITEALEGDAEDAATTEPETPAEEGDREYVLRAFRTMTPGFEPFVKSSRPARWDQIIEVVTYQFGRWKRGVNTVDSQTRAYQQFNRRLNREFSWAARGWGYNRYERSIGHVLSVLRREAAGEVVAWEPIIPTSSEVRERVDEDAIEIMGGDRYYIAHAMHQVGSRWRGQGDLPNEEEGVERLRSTLRDYINQDTVDGTDASVYSAAYGVVAEMFFGQMLLNDAPEGVMDEETLLAWQMSLHPDAGGIQRMAIENGVRMWCDEVRLRPDEVEREGYVEALRRWVQAFGFTKYTGKAMKRIITQALIVVFATHKGEGLTPEQWPVYHERFRTAVAHVAGRYGEAHGFCSQLQKACGELTVSTDKPRTAVRFQGSGLTVEVQVPAWWDDESRLKTDAKSAWTAMTPEKREAAIVTRDDVYVNWSDMRIAR